MTKELEPCPFCPDGGDPNHFGGAGHHCVKCYECGRTNEKLVLTESDGWHYEAFDSVQDAYDDWNTRYKRTCRWSPLVPDPDNPAESHYEYEGNWKTECGEAYVWDDECLPNFCPNCGKEIDWNDCDKPVMEVADGN